MPDNSTSSLKITEAAHPLTTNLSFLAQNDLQKGIEVINEVCVEVGSLYNGTDLKEKDGKYYFIHQGKEIDLYPFVQKGESDGLPYIFQGLYNNKSTAELISTFHGDIEKQEGSNHYNELFDPMRNLLKGGAGQVFDHRNRIEYYNECFVGRDKQSQDVIDWASSDNEKNILPIYSQAGMGKGALVADVIAKLSEENIPVLHHFCGSGLANNLHAIVYHLILQGKKMQLWKTEDEELQKQIAKLPSKFTDVIMLLHTLIDQCFAPTRKNTSGTPMSWIYSRGDGRSLSPSMNSPLTYEFSHNIRSADS